jgi:hypothetical protein
MITHLIKSVMILISVDVTTERPEELDVESHTRIGAAITASTITLPVSVSDREFRNARILTGRVAMARIRPRSTSV